MTTVLDIPLAQVLPHPANPRKDIVRDVAFDDLVASIRANGVEQPCFVVPNTRSAAATGVPRYWLVGGHRRHAASKVAKTKTLPAIRRDDLDTPGKQLRFMLADNLHRLDLTPIETGDAIQAILDLGEGFTHASLAAATGLSTKTIAGRLKLARLPDAARDRVHSGQVTIVDAMAMAEFTADPTTLTTLTKYAGTSGFAYQLARAREVKAGRAALAKATRAQTKAGVTILDVTPDAGAWEYVRRLGAYVATFKVDGDNYGDALDLASQHHQLCPGHAVIISPMAYDRAHVNVDAICTDPATHHPEVATASSQEHVEDEAAAAVLAQDRANLATATKVRRAHLGAVILAADEDLALKTLRAVAKARIGTSYNEVSPTFAAQVLLEYPDAPHLLADPALLAKTVGYAINRLTLPALAMLMSAFAEVKADEDLTNLSCWPGHRTYYASGDRAKSWRKRLPSTWEYSWSPVELELLGQTTDGTPVDDVEADNEDDEPLDVEDSTSYDDEDQADAS